jgi:glycosyltransferase involved in cell wall biosynthesis
MKILVVTGIFPPDIGGPATYVPQVATALVEQQHTVVAVTLSDARGDHAPSYPFRVVRLRRGIFKPLRIILTIITLLRFGRWADLLFVNGLYIEAVVANFFLRKPLVQKVVGDWAWERATNKGWVKDSFEEFQRSRYGLRVEVLKALRTLCVRRAHTLIVPSRYLAHWASHWGAPQKRITVVYNAVEVLSPSALPVPLSTPVKLVTVGRLVPWKQIDHLIAAVAECDGGGLVIVGDGPERPRLEELVRAHCLTGRIYFAGQRSKGETLSLMAGCDLFVLNSTYEGFPHVVLEAMSVGLPVVATSVGGTPELVRDGENGVLIAPSADGTLSKTFLKLLSSSTERQRLAVGAKHTLERFRHSVMIQETKAVLQECVDWHRGGRQQGERSESLKKSHVEGSV